MSGVFKAIMVRISPRFPALMCVVCAALVLFDAPVIFAAQIVETPRSGAPMNDSTALFSKKQFVIGDGIDKRILTYYLLSPQGGSAKDKVFPLVVVLHDTKGKAYAAEQLASGKIRDSLPAYVLVPQSPEGKQWAMPESYPDMPAYKYEPQWESLPDVMAIISKVLDENSIDKQRVYIVGCGDGGAGVYGALLRYPMVFAGGVAINGKWSVNDAPALTEIPLLIEHGAADDIVPERVAQLLADVIGQDGGTVSYQVFPGIGHECTNPDFYSRPMWEALFKQKKVDSQ